MTEQRLIDANALRERMYHDAFETDTDMQKWDSGCWIRYKMFENAIDDAPTIEERKKGKWIDKGVIPNYPEEGFNIYHLLVCDQCGCVHRTTVWCVNGKYINADFCPNCGALMR